MFHRQKHQLAIKLITHCLRFDDRQQRRAASERDKLAPIRNVFDKWVARLKVMYVPGASVTVDEQMIPYRGRVPFLQYIPSEPDPYGIKGWLCTDSYTSYAFNMQVYVGRDRNCAQEIRQGERVVLDMTEGLDGRNVTCDNFFTSRNLALELERARRMTIVGTVRKNRKEIPPVLLDMKRKPVHHSEIVYDHQLRGCMVSYVPKRRRFVTLLSTFHSSVQIDEADPKKKPNIIRFYNATKGGVDVLDKLIATYRSKRKVNRWPVAVFQHMLDVSAVNAYIIYTELFPEWNAGKKYRRRIFLEKLGEQLCNPLIERRTRMPRVNAAARSLAQSMRGIIPPRVEEEGPSSSLVHVPAANKRARCYKCTYSSSANKYSTRCDKCVKYICAAHHYKVCEECATTIRFQ